VPFLPAPFKGAFLGAVIGCDKPLGICMRDEAGRVGCDLDPMVFVDLLGQM
jgi:hypothetical protein